MISINFGNNPAQMMPMAGMPAAKPRIETSAEPSSSSSTPKKSKSTRVRGGMKTRSNTPSSRKNRKRQPSHLKIHHEMLRKRQLEEQRDQAALVPGDDLGDPGEQQEQAGRRHHQPNDHHDPIPGLLAEIVMVRGGVAADGAWR